MPVLLAIAHIVGAIIVLTALECGVVALVLWECDRRRKPVREEISVALGIPDEELDREEHRLKVVQFLAARFSSDLLRNRLSDLCGWIQTGWALLGTLLEVGVIIGVIWYTFTEDLSNSVHAWWIVAISFFFLTSAALFGFTCKLLTGRFPGQARQARKTLAEAVRQKQKDWLASTYKAPF